MIILLSVYNLAYISFCTLFTNDLEIAFLSASLVLLAVMFVIAVKDMLTKLNEEKIKMHEEEVIRTIRNEYLKAHKFNQKKELLSKANILPCNQDIDEDPLFHAASIELENLSNYERKVCLSYLNRISTQGSHEEKEGGEYQGV